MRWRVAHKTVGYGHLYRGRFKAFPIQRGERLHEVLRYVERNAMSADLVERAEDWRWSSLHVRRHRSDELREVLSDWPGGEPADWLRYVNDPMTAKELKRLKLSEERGRPYGDEAWAMQQVDKLGLQHTVRKEGRPKKLVE